VDIIATEKSWVGGIWECIFTFCQTGQL
jgi:hypothetical protein